MSDLEILLDAHPSEEEFEEYAFRRLSETATSSFEEHLLICVQCQDVLSDLDQYIRLMKHSRLSLPWQAAGVSAPWIAEKFGALAALMAVSAAGAAAVLGMMMITRNLAPALAADVVQLVALRGGNSAAIAEARAGGPVDLEIDLSDLPPSDSYHVELVNSSGQLTWSGAVTAAGGKLSVHPLRALRTGMYWVRLYSSSGELLREFGLRAD